MASRVEIRFELTFLVYQLPHFIINLDMRRVDLKMHLSSGEFFEKCI